MPRLLVPYYDHPAAPAKPRPAFAEVAAQLRAAEVRLLGCTDTDYGRRPY
ncbi:hypothetical protein [Streptomyces hokutonensis]